jgi:hypothetical protein
LIPPFVTAGAASLPRHRGRIALELRDADGATLLETAFSSMAVSESSVGVEHFHARDTHVPDWGGRTASSLAVTVAGRRAEFASRAPRSFGRGVGAGGGHRGCASGRSGHDRLDWRGPLRMA